MEGTYIIDSPAWLQAHASNKAAFHAIRLMLLDHLALKLPLIEVVALASI